MQETCNRVAYRENISEIVLEEILEADGPNVVCGGGYYRIEGAAVAVGVGAGHDAPRSAVPMLYQRQGRKRDRTDGPHVVCLHDRYALQDVTERVGAGAGHDAPCCAVPVLY